MNDDELESGLRRVFGDPARRLPDGLVPLDAVYAGAQRRRARRGALSAVAGAGVVVLVLAGIGTWQVLDRRTAQRVAAGASPTAAPSGGLTQNPSVTPTQTATSVVPPTTGSASTVATPLTVPPGFSAVSVTAISPNHWWVLGSDGLVATTEDGGATFALTTATPIARNATQVRFASSSVGWAIAGNEANERPTLWQTTNGGMRWSMVTLDGQAQAVEAGGGSVFALTLRDDGTTSVWSASVSGRGWHRLGSLGTLLQAPHLAVQAGHAVITASTSAAFRVWLYPATGAATSYAAPCTQDVGADDLSATTDSVWMVCVNGMGDSLYRSADGTAWSPVPAASPVVSRLKVGAIDSTHAAVGTQAKTIRLVRSDSSTVTVAHGVPSVVDWTYLAFTNRSDGFALDDSGTLLRTTNGGVNWSRVLFV